MEMEIEKDNWKNEMKMEMENLQAMLRLLSISLYGLDIGNYAKVYEK